VRRALYGTLLIAVSTAYELRNELPALWRVRFARGEGTADFFRFGDVGDGCARGQRLRDSGEAAFAAEFGGGFRLCFGDWCLKSAHTCQSA
jgi:hypothetical protein